LAAPIKAAQLDLGQVVNVAEAFSAITHSCMAHLQANEAGFLQGKDPEYLHQMRVAVRRMRACFSLFRPVLPQTAFAAILAELGRQGAALSAARDWDVFLYETLRALRAQRATDAALTAFERRSARLRRAHLRAAQEVVASAAWQGLWLELGRLLADGAWAEGQPALAMPAGGFSAELLQRRAAVLEKRGRHLDRLDAAGRHRLRIAAKKLRYAAEFFEALYPKKHVRPYVHSLAQVQQVLGGLNDASTSLRLLSEAFAGARLPDPLVEGMIQGWSAAATHLQLDALGPAWDHWQRQKPFWISNKT
ncbi:MAG: CHAD domain-containing protein, partial [Pseudomonadota bacterium]